ncbi:nucleolar transcription factor 1-like [Tubulanus polymorphus]|uniref:nucleolar transcription factor 1-like n=1 Tax=Tubulanus polymorphus TaxID=672921 RepID=UPI003DA31153
MQSVSSNLLISKPPSSSTPGKRKKKQPKTKKEMSPPPDLPFQQQSESESSDDDEIQKSKKMKIELKETAVPDEWQKEDVTELLDRILKALPKNDHLQMKTQCEKFKWEDISFGEHSAEECKAQWLMLSKRIRRFRTLTEMATDAAQMMNEYGVISANKKQLKHRDPDCPKRPMTPFFRYYMDHYKRLKEHNPDMSAPEMTKYLSEQFKDISAKKKKKYNDKYLKDRADYGEAYEKYKQEHPEKFLQANKSSSGTNRKIGPMKPSLAYHIYTTQKVKEHLEKHPELPRKELVEAYRKRWSDMSEARRQKWVRRAMEDKIRYEKEMLEFCEQHPDFVPTGRSVKFNKAEQKIKDMMDGKPVRPPPNAYALFTSITLQGGELKDIPNMERMSEVAKRWKSLTTAEKDVFVKEAEEKNNAFKSEYEEWVKTLTPEEQEKLASEERKRKKKTKDTTKRGSSDESSKTATKKSGKVKRTLYPGEPKKPPGSGYHMFTIEKLPTFSETPAKERLGRISELWRAMTDDEKAEYTRRRDKRVAKYEKALKSFKSTLTPEELENYEASKANTGKSSKSRAKNVKVEPASEDESSSSSSDESDDDDDDSSNEDEEKAPEVIVNGDQKSASSSSSEESAADDSDNGGDDGADSSDDESKSKHSDSEKENRQVPDDNNGQNNEEGSPSASSSSESESEAASKGSSSSEESGDEN